MLYTHLCCHRGNLMLTHEHIKLLWDMQKSNPLWTTHLKSYRCTQSLSYFLIWLMIQLFEHTQGTIFFNLTSDLFIWTQIKVPFWYTQWYCIRRTHEHTSCSWETISREIKLKFSCISFVQLKYFFNPCILETLMYN